MNLATLGDYPKRRGARECLLGPGRFGGPALAPAMGLLSPDGGCATAQAVAQLPDCRNCRQRAALKLCDGARKGGEACAIVSSRAPALRARQLCTLWPLAQVRYVAFGPKPRPESPESRLGLTAAIDTRPEPACMPKALSHLIDIERQRGHFCAPLWESGLMARTREITVLVRQ